MTHTEWLNHHAVVIDLTVSRNDPRCTLPPFDMQAVEDAMVAELRRQVEAPVAEVVTPCPAEVLEGRKRAMASELQRIAADIRAARLGMLGFGENTEAQRLWSASMGLAAMAGRIGT